MKIVLDTNALIMSISKDNIYYKIWNDYVKGKYILCVSNDIVTEYEEILRKKIDDFKIVDNILRIILTSKNTQFVYIYYNFNLINIDPDDNKFVDCAIAANATYIVSNDKHFNILKNISFPKLVVKKVQEFREILLKLK